MEIITKITLEWVCEQFVTTVRYYMHYFIYTRYNKSKNDDKDDDIHTSTRLVYLLLMTSQPVADDVTMTRQLRRWQVKNDIYSRQYLWQVV